MTTELEIGQLWSTYIDDAYIYIRGTSTVERLKYGFYEGMLLTDKWGRLHQTGKNALYYDDYKSTPYIPTTGLRCVDVSDPAYENRGYLRLKDLIEGEKNTAVKLKYPDVFPTEKATFMRYLDEAIKAHQAAMVAAGSDLARISLRSTYTYLNALHDLNSIGSASHEVS